MIHSRAILLRALVPQHCIWKFLEEFGTHFARPATSDLGQYMSIRAVECYATDPRNPDQTLIGLVVSPEEEPSVTSFIHSFQNGLKP